ncbi:MAG: hypothetical protein AAGK04_13935 [Planctomycetota bacterium]
MIAARDIASLLKSFPPPTSIEGWQAHAATLLSDLPCVFHRNHEISAAYGGAYLRHPNLFKWAGMAAFASHHARLLLLPFKLDQLQNGEVDLERFGDSRHGVALADIDTIRQINNAIFDDIYWAHLAYDAEPAGLARLESLLDAPEWAPMLDGFRLIERGRQLLEAAPDEAERLIWRGNVQLLYHEQTAIVQPKFDRLGSGFARLFSLGSSLSFEAATLRERTSYFANFYTHMLLRRPGLLLKTRSLPRVNRLDHRWPWIETRLVPNFRRLERDRARVRAKLERIVAVATMTPPQSLESIP